MKAINYHLFQNNGAVTFYMLQWELDELQTMANYIQEESKDKELLRYLFLQSKTCLF